MQADSSSLTILESLILGVVQGISEFLPISSDGHLVLARHLIGYQQDLITFDVLLHFGTLGSIFVIFWKDALQLTKDWWHCVFRPSDFFARQYRFSSFVFATTFVTGVLGLVFEKAIESIFNSLLAAGIGFLFTSVLLFIGTFKRFGSQTVVEQKPRFAFIVGAAQALAILPGVSRSGSTIATALIFGCSREQAGRYSFVAAMPIIFMASLYKSKELIGRDLAQLSTMFAGVAIAFVVGVFAIRILLWMLQKQNLYPFAIYTFILGIVSIAASFS